MTIKWLISDDIQPEIKIKYYRIGLNEIIKIKMLWLDENKINNKMKWYYTL